MQILARSARIFGNHQLLFDRYLTWRNSKAAVIIFVRNKDFSAVLHEVKATTPTHPNYVGFANEREETWFNYNFHINDNPDRPVKLAMLLFHITPVGKAVNNSLRIH